VKRISSSRMVLCIYATSDADTALAPQFQAVAAARRGKKLLDSQGAAADDKTRMEIEERINQELAESGAEHISPGSTP
jgi:MoxR-like ATPase